MGPSALLCMRCSVLRDIMSGAGSLRLVSGIAAGIANVPSIASVPVNLTHVTPSML